MSGEANFRFLDDYQSAEAAHARVWACADLAYEVRQRELERRDRRIDLALQICILVLSAAAVSLLTSPGPIARWGHVVGMASQPFWIWATWRALPKQWGMFILAVGYCGLWARGIANHFFF